MVDEGSGETASASARFSTVKSASSNEWTSLILGHCGAIQHSLWSRLRRLHTLFRCSDEEGRKDGIGRL